MSQARIVDARLEIEVAQNRLTHPDDIAHARETIADHVAFTIDWLDNHTECERWTDETT